MRTGDFQKALSFYQKSKNFKGIPRTEAMYDDKGNYHQGLVAYKSGVYDGTTIFRHWYSEEING
jgi:hypothetical protein